MTPSQQDGKNVSERMRWHCLEGKVLESGTGLGSRQTCEMAWSSKLEALKVLKNVRITMNGE